MELEWEAFRQQLWSLDHNKTQLWFCLHTKQQTSRRLLRKQPAKLGRTESVCWLSVVGLLLCFHFISSAPWFLASHLSSGVFSWFCGACRWSLARASCRSCWWAVGAGWAWGHESGKPADLQRTSGYLSYLMHMHSMHTHIHTKTEEWEKHWMWMSFKISECRRLTLTTKRLLTEKVMLM